MTTAQCKELANDDETKINALTMIPDRIKRLIFNHVFPLTCIGARHGSVSNKIHAAVHGVRLECEDWQDARDLLHMFFAQAVDSGPEKNFTRFDFSPSEIYPHWCKFDIQREDDFDAMDGALQPDYGGNIDMKATLQLPGSFHSINNMDMRTLNSLPLYEKHKPGINSAAHTFHFRHCRECYTETCLVDDRITWRAFFSSGPPTMDGGRSWGVVSEITDYFVERQNLIENSWDVARVSFNDGAAGGGNDLTVDRAHLARTNESFVDQEWWSTMHLIKILEEMFGAIEAFMLTCVCHGKSDCEEMGIEAFRDICPMRGCNVCRMACNEHLEVFDRIGTTHQNRLIPHTVRLNEGSRHAVMANFTIGKNGIFAELSVRFNCTEHIPIKICCFGHPDKRKARTHGALCLIEYENIPLEEQQLPLTDEVCNPAGPTFGEAIDFIQGGDFALVPRLRVVRNKGKFASNVETAIERDHAFLHRQIILAPHHSEAFASLGIRRPNLVSAVDESRAAAIRFSELLDSNRSAASCIEALGLAAHPSLRDFVNDRGELDKNLPQHVACRVVYHADLQSMFLDLPDLCAGNGPPPTEPLPHGGGAEDDDLMGIFGDEPPRMGEPGDAPSASPSGAGAGAGPSAGGASGSGGASDASNGALAGSSLGGHGASKGGKKDDANGGGGGDGGDASHAGKSPAPPKDALRFIKQRLQVEHFLQTSKPGTFYTMNTSRNLDSMTTRLNPKLKCSATLMAKLQGADIDWDVIRERCDLPELCMDKENDGEGGVAHLFSTDTDVRATPAPSSTPTSCSRFHFRGTVMIFTIALKHPQSLHNKVNQGRDSPFLSTDITVNLAQIHHVDGVNRSVFVSETAANAQKDIDHRILAGHVADFETMASCVESMWSFTLEPETQYICKVPALQRLGIGRISRTLRALYKCDAREANMEPTKVFVCDRKDPDHMPILLELEAEGIVTRTFEKEQTASWQVSEVGEGLVEYCSRIRPCSRVNECRADLEPSEQTVWELVNSLLRQGWSAEVWEDSSVDPNPFVVAHGGLQFNPNPPSIRTK